VWTTPGPPPTHRYTSIVLLILFTFSSLQVRFIENCESTLSPEVRQVVIEIVQILLTAGYDTVNGSCDSRPLDILLNYHSFYNPPTGSRSTHDFARKSLFPLIFDIVNMLLMNGADPTQNGTEFVCHRNILFCASQMMEITEVMMPGVPGTPDPCCSMMDTFGDIFRCLMLARTGVNITDVFFDEFTDEDVFMDYFVSIAGLSSQPGRSKRLIRLILNGLSPNQLTKLRTKLSSREELMTDDSPDQLRMSTNSALKLLGGVETPPPLQRLVQRVIIHRMSFKSLMGDSTLELPPHMLQYIQLND